MGVGQAGEQGDVYGIEPRLVPDSSRPHDAHLPGPVLAVPASDIQMGVEPRGTA